MLTLTGFGVHVHPSGAKSYIVNYRAGNGGRKAPNKRVVVGRAGRVTPDQARRLAQELLGRVAAGDNPAGERTEARRLPRLGEACENYIESGHGEVLPCWRKGMEEAVPNPVHRDVLLFGLYTGMRRGEIMALRWEDVDLGAGLFRVEETKTGVPLELPVTRQVGKILARRQAESDALPEELRGWVFPSRSSESGHVEELQAHYEAIGAHGRSEVLVPCVAQLLHHRGRAGADAATVSDQAAGEPRAAQ